METLEDGKVYYTTTDKQKISTSTTILPSDSSLGFILTKDIFYYAHENSLKNIPLYAREEYSPDDLYAKFNITLAGPIADTNANISAETAGNTASFDTSGTSSIWYAYTAEGKKQIEEDTTAPVIKGVKKNKYYQYHYMPNISISDNVAVTKITLNGSNATPSQQTMLSKEDEIRYQLIKGRTKKYIIYDWVTIADNCEVSLVKEGKNVLTAYDLHGNTTSVTYYVDSKAPIIKGVKNKKTYRKQAILYVKDKQKLAKVTVNNKKQKLSRKNLVKKGKYKGYYKIKVSQKGSNYITAYDQAGNKKNITINIVK